MDANPRPDVAELNEARIVLERNTASLTTEITALEELVARKAPTLQVLQQTQLVVDKTVALEAESAKVRDLTKRVRERTVE
jgi:hypothetical protein